MVYQAGVSLLLTGPGGCGHAACWLLPFITTSYVHTWRFMEMQWMSWLGCGQRFLRGNPSMPSLTSITSHWILCCAAHAVIEAIAKLLSKCSTHVTVMWWLFVLLCSNRSPYIKAVHALSDLTVKRFLWVAIYSIHVIIRPNLEARLFKVHLILMHERCYESHAVQEFQHYTKMNHKSSIEIQS